jgi:hypothetical protein
MNGRRPSRIHSLLPVIVAAPTALGRSFLCSFCTVVNVTQSTAALFAGGPLEPVCCVLCVMLS